MVPDPNTRELTAKPPKNAKQQKGIFLDVWHLRRVGGLEMLRCIAAASLHTMQRLRAWRWWPWLRDGALALLLLLGVRAYQLRDVAQGMAPVLAGTDLDGRTLLLESYRGKPVLLHFWATWCGVCKAEQSNIDELAGALPVVSVASKSGEATQVAAYVREHAIAPRVVVDRFGLIAHRFGVRAFPTTFVIDAAGRIRHVEVGYSSELGLRLRMWLAKIIP
jgi:thiol-disulfide isomerase/thioredoxin